MEHGVSMVGVEALFLRFVTLLDTARSVGSQMLGKSVFKFCIVHGAL